ncbi:aldehyde dehydrogenase family protein [Nocardioides sp. WS12]|uniref:aldehyde dehydrogenase family protein n=1 Tax=Nocardioides sp. WS12 TaxID=2486272 RepID=UPI0015FA0B73|nr:aldehyde dehydrogenase family protein [Nocardioides sp. WS12]
MHNRNEIYVNGAWVRPHGTDRLEVINSATEEVIGTIPDCNPVDVDAAVAAARAAFDSWSTTPVADRVKCLNLIAEGLAARGETLGDLLSAEVGMPVLMARQIQVGFASAIFAATASVLENYEAEQTLGKSLIVREPVGVVAAITPWNFPLQQSSAKVALALAAGCTVVLKPSEITPLGVCVLAEVIDEVGLPPGVFNLVLGSGPGVGEALVAHPDVDMVTFTGSTRAGKRVQQLAAETVKRVTLELGGKSPNVLLEDADLPAAVTNAVHKAYFNSGQTCSALTRLIVPRSRLAEVEELAKQVAESIPMGDPTSETSVLGPLVSDLQRERVRGYIRTGIEEGAKLITGGPEAPEGLERGYYVRATIFSEVTTAMTIHKEEIFGPVLAIEPYDTEAEAIEIANDTIYGLAGAVWSADRARAIAVARKIRAGQIEVNGGDFNLIAPFGGYKQSGNGRENGSIGLEEFFEIKSLQL